MTQAIAMLPTRATSLVGNTAKVHIFFCIPKGKGGYHVLGDAKTASALRTAGGFKECAMFQRGEYPDAMKEDILSGDRELQSRHWKNVSLHFFCNRIYYEAVLDRLESLRGQMLRELVLHTGNDIVGWATFTIDGYACGSKGQH